MALNQVPNPTQTLGQTNLPIKQNFQTIDTGFSVDHVTFGAAGVGKHQKVTFPNTTPVPAFVAPDIGLFNQLAVPTTRQDIWMARGASTPFPITGYDNGAIAANAAVSWSYLPSGWKVIGGNSTTSAGASGSRTITFASSAGGGLDSFPGFTSFVVYIGAQRIDASAPGGQGFMGVRSYNLNSCVIANMNGSGTAAPFFWIAVGL